MAAARDEIHRGRLTVIVSLTPRDLPQPREQLACAGIGGRSEPSCPNLCGTVLARFRLTPP